MSTQTDLDARTVLAYLSAAKRDEYIESHRISADTGLPPDRLDDAVALLVESGYVEWTQAFGTAPFNFADAMITSRGRYEAQRLAASGENDFASKGEMSEPVSPPSAHPAVPNRPPSPVGSPYGFTDEDWEAVAGRKSRSDRLYVVLGHQSASSWFKTEVLRQAVRAMFKVVVARHNERARGLPVVLKFKALGAGYGEHLFNEIARDIIGADIAVFETSDQNPNVMLEMGVALTWGVRVLPIKLEGQPKPPSDVSGQTWADYRESGTAFVDPDHLDKLFQMVERALKKKGASLGSTT